jgi:6-pyruvoyltetrahydropterin/6-carboxytetrahydropterin synthase
MYRVTKTLGHDRGISCAFRQWRADSHCRFIHGYALAFSVVLESEDLNANNWVYDFGGFAEFEDAIRIIFDHTLAIAADDPEKEALMALSRKGVAMTRIFEHVGCEAFAELAYGIMDNILNNQESEAADRNKPFMRPRIVSVTVSEHSSNSATYMGEV